MLQSSWDAVYDVIWMWAASDKNPNPRVMQMNTADVRKYVHIQMMGDPYHLRRRKAALVLGESRQKTK